MQLAWILPISLAAACAKTTPPARTEHERDSVVAQSRLPGAAGVKAALKASDSASARGARLDSVTP